MFQSSTGSHASNLQQSTEIMTGQLTENTNEVSTIYPFTIHNQSKQNIPYFGPSSVFSLLLEVGKDIPSLYLNAGSILPSNNPTLSLYDHMTRTESKKPGREIAKALFDCYYQSIESFYPIIGLRNLQHILDSAYEPSPNIFTPAEAEVLFDIIIAISLWLSGKDDSRLLPVSRSIFRKVTVDSISKSTLGTSKTKTLQITLLMSVYALLSPISGNPWRLLGHACRLCLEGISEKLLYQNRDGLEYGLYWTTFTLDWSVQYHESVMVIDITTNSILVTLQ